MKENGLEYNNYQSVPILQPPSPKEPGKVGGRNVVENKSTLTYKDYENFVTELGGGIDPLVLQAVTLVESEMGGFYKNGNPVVRFEGHKFREYYTNHGIPEPSGYSDLFYNYNERYKKKHGESTFLKALSLNRDAAIYATSFGFGQVMGFNYKEAGFTSLEDFYQSQFNLNGQIKTFVRFIKSNKILISALKRKDFTAFAKNYNGSDYKANNYDDRMEAKYESLLKNIKN